MKRHIKLTPDASKKLAEELGISDSFVYDALYYRKVGPSVQKVRQEAIRLGGRYVDPDFIPTCNTEYLEGQIRQTFAAGVVLTIDRKTGKAVITVDDSVVRKEDAPVRMTDLNILAREAQELAVQRVINS